MQGNRQGRSCSKGLGWTPGSFARLVGGAGVWRCIAAMGLVLTMLALSREAHAERLPKTGPQDPRIRSVVYNARDVVRVDGTYGYHTVVELAEDERIESLVIGDSLAWEATRNAEGNRIFLKPLEDDASTNLTVLTDRRTYSFALSASRSTSKDRMTWRLRFEYPEDATAERQLEIQRAALERTSTVNPEAPTNPGRWNFEYQYAGSERLLPNQVFDDGQFTYLRFDEGAELPAIFIVDAERNETLVNTRVAGAYVIVHRIAKQLTLRLGSVHTCIFNEAYSPGDARASVHAPAFLPAETAGRRSGR